MKARITNIVHIKLQGDWTDRVEFIRKVNDIPKNATVVIVNYAIKFNVTIIIFKWQNRLLVLNTTKTILKRKR